MGEKSVTMEQKWNLPFHSAGSETHRLEGAGRASQSVKSEDLCAVNEPTVAVRDHMLTHGHCRSYWVTSIECMKNDRFQDGD